MTNGNIPNSNIVGGEHAKIFNLNANIVNSNIANANANIVYVLLQVLMKNAINANAK